MNSDLYDLDSGAESAIGLKSGATSRVSESIGAPCKGGGILRPYRAQHVLGYVSGALPRAGMLRAVGASSWLRSRAEKAATKRRMRQLLVRVRLEKHENNYAGDGNVEPDGEGEACDSAVHGEAARQREKERGEHHREREDGKYYVAG
jgi:hypothetical protein